jgi:prolyl 4-hydroxylase
MSTAVHQPITPEARAWITAQAAGGQPRALLLQAMIASGWNEASAVAAICAVLDGGAVAAPQPSTPVPDPLAGESGTALVAEGRAVHVLAAMQSPRVIVFGGLLDDAECDEMVELARRRLTRSETVQTDTGTSEVNAARTSDGMFFERGEFPLCARIEARIAALLRWPLENGEGLQVLRYRAGAEYRPHYDYFDPGQPGTPALLRRGGQRVASLVCYLNTPARGGATIFPDVGLEVAPVKGNAVFFSYDRPHPGTKSLHGGAPVVDGEKWVATKWVREGRFE